MVAAPKLPPGRTARIATDEWILRETIGSPVPIGERERITSCQIIPLRTRLHLPALDEGLQRVEPFPVHFDQVQPPRIRDRHRVLPRRTVPVAPAACQSIPQRRLGKMRIPLPGNREL